MRRKPISRRAVGVLFVRSRDEVSQSLRLNKSASWLSYTGASASLQNMGYNEKLLWRCDRDHEWSARVGLIKAGNWCPICSGKAPIEPIQEAMAREAAKRGGRSLATSPLRAYKKSEWECEAGHRWFASFSKVKRGTWCPNCVGRLPPENLLSEMRREARKYGSELLSKSATIKGSR